MGRLLRVKNLNTSWLDRHLARQIGLRWSGDLVCSRSEIRKTGFRRERFDWGNEPVPATGQRLDVFRFFSRIGQRLAQFVDCFVQAVLEIDEGLARPQLALNFLS